MNTPIDSGVRRRMLFKTAWAAAAAAMISRVPEAAEAHDLKPGDPVYQFDRYEGILNRQVRVRQLYAWPNIANTIIWPNIANGLNGFQFSYGVPPDQIQVVVQAYASANGAMYDDYIWAKYKFGDALNVKDPSTGQPASGNIWFKSKIPASEVSAPPASRSHAYYGDTSIEGLQRRGVLFLI